ncbi:MAG TPA: hypothetical protein PKB09_00585 [Candidatus Saccharibacteria bacterium]|nr:hypothetical protein [Candidatus Saccharibacteria bacterium]
MTALAQERISKQAPNTLNATELLESANAYMQERGLTVDMIDPRTVVVALHGPKEIDAIHDHTRNARIKRYSEEPTTPEEDSLLDDTTSLTERRLTLSRGRRIRRYVGAVAASAALTAGSMWGLFETDADLQETRTNVPASIEDVTSHDRSFLPGSLGANTPFVRNLRELIPGIPERSPFETTRVVTQERRVQERQVQRNNTYTTADSESNPVATDLSLTGEEYQLAHDAAEELVSNLGNPNRFTVTSFGAFGRASDEFNGTLGKLDPEQRTLYLARAMIAARALSDVLREHGFTVLVDPRIDGEEVVLTQDQIDSLRGQELDQELARGRVSELQLEGTKEVVRNVPRTRYVRTKQTEEYGGDLNPEVMAAVLMGGFMALSKLTRTREPKKAANRAARRQLHQAERRKARGDRRADKREKVTA